MTSLVGTIWCPYIICNGGAKIIGGAIALPAYWSLRLWDIRHFTILVL